MRLYRMSFVKKIIGPDETLIGITSAHWIYGATGILWLAGMMVIGLVLDYYATGLFDYLFRDTGAFAVNRISEGLFWIPTCFGLVMFVMYFLMMISPEIGLTTKRVIHKRGIIFVDVKEVDLEEIKAADVNNGLFGRFLNYGFVVFDARFVAGMDLPAIGKPYRFVKALNEARSRLKQDSMTVVLEGGGAVKTKVEEPQPEQQAAPPEKPKRKHRIPKLTNPRYEDKMENSTHQAVTEVVHEAAQNMKAAMHDKTLDELKNGLHPKAQGGNEPRQPQSPSPNTEPEPRPQPQKPGEEAQAAPIVFNNELLNRERQLRREIKDDFATKH
jgi:hypothetical protein